MKRPEDSEDAASGGPVLAGNPVTDPGDGPGCSLRSRPARECAIIKFGHCNLIFLGGHLFI